VKVWVYPEKKYEEFGAIRYQVEWYEMTPQAIEKSTLPDYDFDPDVHTSCCAAYFSSKALAVQYAKQVLHQDNLAYGQVTVGKQVVDWYVEEDEIAEWVNAGEPEYFD
jgi:hypothetical protein